MKNLFFTLSVCALINVFCFAQTHSLAYDLGGDESTDRGFTISKMEDGLMIAAGRFCNNSVSCFGFIKTNFEGIEQWRVHFDNYPYIIKPSISSVIKKDNGNYVIGGSIWHSTEAIETRSYLMEFDSLNTLIWRQEYGLSSFCAGVKVLNDGGFLLYGIKIVGNITKRYFVKTDSEGNMEWEQTLPLVEESASNSVWSLELLDDGEMLQMIGTKSYTVADGKTLVLLDSDFNILRSENLNQFNFPLSTVANIARKKLDGGYVVPLRVDSITPVAFETGTIADVVLSLDSDFNTDWVLPFPAYSHKIIANIIIAENGDIIGCGRDSNLEVAAEPSSQFTAGWLFRISPTGELIWDRQYYIEEHLAWYGGFRLDDIIEMPDGRITATGSRMDRRKDGTTNGNTWLLIVDEEGCLTPDCEEQAVWITTAVEEPEEGILSTYKQVFFTISPNPASDFARIDFYNPLQASSQISIYSEIGQLLDQKVLAKGTKKHEIKLDAFKQGICFVTLEKNGRILQKSKLIIH